MAQGNWTKKEQEDGWVSLLLPIFLLTVCPVFVIVFWYCLAHCDGSFAALGVEALIGGLGGVPAFMRQIWPNPLDGEAWRLIGTYAAFELLLMRLMPGKEFVANATATGHRPVYKANGMQCYLATLAAYLLLVATGHFDSYKVYDKFGEILSGLCFGSLLFVLALYFKGLYAPSTADSGSSGSFIKDYYWGTELYPRVLGWDVKVFTNCRFGMMYWAVGILCYAHKQIHAHGSLTDSMAVSVALQLAYITKFFWWESGYMNTMDIQHDRAGYYICWGCLVWLPGVYTFTTFYLAAHPRDLGAATAAAVFVLGVFCIWANYDADRQRAHFRSVGGKCAIWGRPARSIVASYSDGRGGTKKSLLLTSGWWALSRHFHYIPEIGASLCWAAPAGLGHVAPYFYAVYLTGLLTHRAFRDDVRCRAKYGKDWDRYCEKVPHKIVPGLL
ncbi:unnamed protein product [Phaeothamnion confervicola]